jgi:hypothetical protein
VCFSCLSPLGPFPKVRLVIEGSLLFTKAYNLLKLVTHRPAKCGTAVPLLGDTVYD